MKTTPASRASAIGAIKDQVIELGRYYALWWYFVEKSNAVRYERVERSYPDFFLTLADSLRASFFVTAYRLFDKRTDFDLLAAVISRVERSDPGAAMPDTKDQKCEDSVRSTELAAVLVLCQESPKPPTFSTLPATTTIPVTPEPRYVVTPEPRYISEQSIESILDDGNFIKLDEGSLWQVAPFDSASSGSWTESSEITMIRVDNSSRPYKLLNTDDNESVCARQVR